MHNQWQTSMPSRFVEELPLEHVERTNMGSSHSYTPKPPRLPKIEAREMPTRSTEEREFQMNQRIFHLKFGYGRVTGIEGDKLEIDFDHSGLKRVMKSFVESAE